MWIPTIISCIIIFLATIILIVFEKIKKIEQNTGIYRIVEFIGLYIPSLIIGGNYSYMKTDTLKETIIVASTMCIGISILSFYIKIGIKNRYSYIFYPIIIFSCYFIYNLIKPFMLGGFEKGFVMIMIGNIWANSIRFSKNKVRFIISSIIVFLIIMIVPNNKVFCKKTYKLEKVAREHVENLGYNITINDSVFILSDVIRNKPVKLWIARRTSDNEWTLKGKFELIYNNGEIIEFKDES